MTNIVYALEFNYISFKWNLKNPIYNYLDC